MNIYDNAGRKHEIHHICVYDNAGRKHDATRAVVYDNAGNHHATEFLALNEFWMFTQYATGHRAWAGGVKETWDGEGHVPNKLGHFERNKTGILALWTDYKQHEVPMATRLRANRAYTITINGVTHAMRSDSWGYNGDFWGFGYANKNAKLLVKAV